MNINETIAAIVKSVPPAERAKVASQGLRIIVLKVALATLLSVVWIVASLLR